MLCKYEQCILQILLQEECQIGLCETNLEFAEFVSNTKVGEQIGKILLKTPHFPQYFTFILYIMRQKSMCFPS